MAPLPPLRLTARGRYVGAAIGLLAGVAAGVAAGASVGIGAGGGGGVDAASNSPSGVASSAGELRLAGDRSVVVRPGETLWLIAGSIAGSDDIRSVVWRIRELNGLRNADLVPGQVLRLP